MAEHSNVVGGSSARKRLHCAASYSLELSMPEQAESEFARRGSMLHAAMELLLTADPRSSEDVQAHMDALLGQDLGFSGLEITQDLIDDKLVPALDAWFRIDREFGIADYWIEQRVSLEAVLDGAFGTSDLIAVDSRNMIHVLDWKFGDGVPVPVEGNEGCLFYGAGVLHDPEEEMLELRRALDKAYGDEPIKFMFHIVQPRAGMNEDPLQSWACDEDTIEDFLDQLISSIERAKSKEPQPKTGDWCKWCAAKSICPAQTALVLETQKVEPVMPMTSVEIAKYLDMADLVEAWIKEIRRIAHDEAENGVQIPGRKLVQKRATRKWVDEDEVVAACKQSKLKIDQMYNKTLKSPAQLEKSAKNVFAKKLHKMVHSVSSGLTLVREDDPRPAFSDPMKLLANALDDTEN